MSLTHETYIAQGFAHRQCPKAKTVRTAMLSRVALEYGRLVPRPFVPPNSRGIDTFKSRAPSEDTTRASRPAVALT